MKKILLLFAVAATVVACEKNPVGGNKSFVFDWDKKARIESGQVAPASQVLKATNPLHLSDLEIVKQTTNLTGKYWSSSSGKFTDQRGGFSGRDLTPEKPAFLMQADFIFHKVGFDDHIELYDGLITAYDLVLERSISDTKNLYDTIGYIPNANMRATESAIRAAVAEQDTAKVYDIFYNAWKFYPCTGEEWRALKAQDKN